MEDDSFVQDYEPSELAIAAEFLTNWLPFLTSGLCDGCSASLRSRIHSLRPGSSPEASGCTSVEKSNSAPSVAAGPFDPLCCIQPTGWDVDLPEASESPRVLTGTRPTGRDLQPASSESPRARMSWADMAQEDELEAAEEEEKAEAERSSEEAAEGELKGKGDAVKKETGLSREQREQIRFKNVGRKKDFICLERVKGKIVNILEGLELHTGVFSAAEQKRIVDFIYEIQEKGRNHELREYTYSEPHKWMRGKGRVTIQFGCCYNYAMDKKGNPPGILRHVIADAMPALFKVIIRRLVRWHVLPTTCIPDSCIVNIYEPGDCIPPHIDSHDFVRPFCTVSFLSECDVVFGSSLQVAGPGEFVGSAAITLPVGSVLVMNGNGADVAKHCIPAVPTKRISITFRKMDVLKWPTDFVPESDLQDIQTLEYTPEAKGQSLQDKNRSPVVENKNYRRGRRNKGRSSATRPGPNFQEWQHQSNDSGFHTRRPNHWNQDGQYPSNGGGSNFERGSSSSQRMIEPKPRSDMQGVESHYDNGSELTNSAELFEQQEEEGTGNVESVGRKVRVEQRRIIISRSIEAEDKDLPPGAGSPGPPHVSRVQVRSLNNSRQRVRVNFSDG